MDQTGVYNLALGRLGIGKAVASPTERSNEAQKCNQFYDLCRQEVLRAFPWGFATAAVSLAEVEDQTFPGWTFVYRAPSKSLRVRYVCDEQGVRVSRTVLSWADTDQIPEVIKQPWQVALKADGASQILLSDVAQAWAIFTVDVPNTGAWAADFASVLAWRLGMEVGGPLQARADLIQNCFAMYGIWYRNATAASFNEQRDDPRAESASITCRY